MKKLEEHLKKLEEFDLTFTKKNKDLYLLNYHGFVFELLHKEHELYLKGKITDCPDLQREALFSYLMRANLLGQSTYGSVLGLTPDEKSLTLISSLPYETTYEELKEKLELFLGAKEFWEKGIKDFINKARK